MNVERRRVQIHQGSDISLGMREDVVGVALLDRTLGNKDTLRELLIGDKYAVLASAASEMETFDTTQRAEFLRGILHGLASEDDYWDVDRRDGAIELLPIVNLRELEQNQVEGAYLEAIASLKRHPDPEGSVDALITAGSVLAPHFPTGVASRNALIGAWVSVTEKYRLKNRRIVEEKVRKTIPEFSLIEWVKQLKERGFTKKQIREELGITRSHMDSASRKLVATGEITVAKRRTSAAISAFDRNVAILRKRGLDNVEIATRLGEKERNVKEALRRLLANGTVSRRRASAEEVAELDPKVLRLVKTGLTNGEIAARLKEKKSKIRKSVERLISAGEIVAGQRRIKPHTSNRVKHFDTAVKKLRDANFSIPQIVGLLKANESRVKKAVARLIAAEEVESRKGKKRGQIHDTVIFDVQIARLRARGIVSIDEVVAKTQGATRWKVARSITRLAKSGEIERSIPSPEEMVQRVADVQRLVEKGLKNEAIARELLLTEDQVIKAKAKTKAKTAKEEPNIF